MAQSQDSIQLPGPALTGQYSLEQALSQRRSVREYLNSKLRLSELGQLLWAAQGITSIQGFRTAPSAGALYPLELYVVAVNVEGLDPGLYHFHPGKFRLTLLQATEFSKILSHAALGQRWVEDAAAVVVFAAVYERTTKKYGQRGQRYVHIETGHAAQNLFLQAQTLRLGTVVVGAFDDEEVAQVLHLPPEVKPLLLMPIGRI